MLQLQATQNRPRQRPQLYCIQGNLTFVWMAMALLCNSVPYVRSVSIESAAYKDIVFEISPHVPVEKCADFLFDLEVSSSECTVDVRHIWNTYCIYILLDILFHVAKVCNPSYTRDASTNGEHQPVTSS